MPCNLPVLRGMPDMKLVNAFTEIFATPRPFLSARRRVDTSIRFARANLGRLCPPCTPPGANWLLASGSWRRRKDASAKPDPGSGWNPIPSRWNPSTLRETCAKITRSPRRLNELPLLRRSKNCYPETGVQRARTLQNSVLLLRSLRLLRANPGNGTCNLGPYPS